MKNKLKELLRISAFGLIFTSFSSVIGMLPESRSDSNSESSSFDVYEEEEEEDLYDSKRRSVSFVEPERDQNRGPERGQNDVQAQLFSIDPEKIQQNNHERKNSSPFEEGFGVDLSELNKSREHNSPQENDSDDDIPGRSPSRRAMEAPKTQNPIPPESVTPGRRGFPIQRTVSQSAEKK